VGTDEFWVEAVVPLDKLSLMDIHREGGCPVQIRSQSGGGGGWQGRVVRIAGKLNETSRMATVIVAVDNPLEPLKDSAAARLMIDDYVFVEIAGRQSIQAFGQVHIGIVHGHMKTAVDAFGRLILDGGDHLGMAVAHVVYTDAAGKIDEFTAVDIHHDRPPSFPYECVGGVKGSLGDVLITFCEECIVSAWHMTGSLFLF
jgi:hypothetical protein